MTARRRRCSARSSPCSPCSWSGLLRSHAEILKRLHDLGAGHRPASPAAAAQLRRRRRPPSRPRLPGDAPGALAARPRGVRRRGRPGRRRRRAAPRRCRSGSPASSTTRSSPSSPAGCLTCQKFWDAFRKPRKLGLPAGTRLVVVTKGPDAESPSAVAELAPPGVPTVMSTEAFTDYDVPGLAVLRARSTAPPVGCGARAPGPDWDQVSSLLSQATVDAELAATLAGSQVAKPDADADREARIDRELYDAGVAPGDPSLYSVERRGRARPR